MSAEHSRAYRARNRDNEEWKARERAYQKAYRDRHRERFLARWKAYHTRTRHLPHAKQKERERNLRRYGLTVAGHAEMLTAQGGCCAICNETLDRRAFVDHDHETGRVRGLLCLRCNSGIGHFRDDPARLRAAAAYLEKKSG